MDLINCTRISHASARKLDQSCTTCRFFRTDALSSQHSEAGIGKTRLATEFLAWATIEGADVLQGQAFETGGHLPYQPVIEALRPRIERENAPDDLLTDVWLAELSRLLPELRDRYPDLPTPLGDRFLARSRLFEALARLGQALAARPPLSYLSMMCS